MTLKLRILSSTTNHRVLLVRLFPWGYFVSSRGDPLSLSHRAFPFPPFRILSLLTCRRGSFRSLQQIVAFKLLLFLVDIYFFPSFVPTFGIFGLLEHTPDNLLQVPRFAPSPFRIVVVNLWTFSYFRGASIPFLLSSSCLFVFVRPANPVKGGQTTSDDTACLSTCLNTAAPTTLGKDHNEEGSSHIQNISQGKKDSTLRVGFTDLHRVEKIEHRFAAFIADSDTQKRC